MIIYIYIYIYIIFLIYLKYVLNEKRKDEEKKINSIF